MVVGGGAQVFGHGFHRAVGPRETDDKGDGLFVFARGQIVAVDALIGGALHPQGGELEGGRLGQGVADAGGVDVDALRLPQQAVDAQHIAFVEGKAGVGDGLVVEPRQGVDDVGIGAVGGDGLVGQNLPDPLVLVDLGDQLQLELMVPGKPQLLAQADHGGLAGQGGFGKLAGRHVGNLLHVGQNIVCNVLFVVCEVFHLFQLHQQHDFGPSFPCNTPERPPWRRRAGPWNGSAFLHREMYAL